MRWELELLQCAHVCIRFIFFNACHKYFLSFILSEMLISWLSLGVARGFSSLDSSHDSQGVRW